MDKTKCTPRYILMVCTIAYTSIYIARLNLSVASPLFEQGGYMTKMHIGIMGGVFFAVYAVGRMVNGFIGDALSAKRLLLTGLILVAAANMGIALMPPVTLIILLWGVNGMAQSMLWGPALRLVGGAYSGSSFLHTAGVILSSGIGIGSLLAIVLSYLLVGVGLNALFAIPSLLVLAAALPLLALPNIKEKSERPNIQQMTALLKNPNIRRMMLPAIAHGMIKENLILWAPLLFIELYGIDLRSAAIFVFLMPAAMLLGRVTYPIIERWCCKDEKRVSIWSFTCCIICLIPFFFFEPPSLLTAMLLAVVALAVSVISVAFIAVHPLRYEKNNQVSMVAGLLDSVTYAGSAAGSLLLGLLVSWGGYMPMIYVFAAVSLASVGSLLPTVLRQENTKKTYMEGLQ